MTHTLSTQGLTVGYDGQPLIREITLSLRRGEILSLIGPNGAGKSTILKSLTRHLAPIAGTVYLENDALCGLSPRQIARRLAVVLTERIRPEMMTCYDVVATGRYPYTGHLGTLTAADHAVIRRCLDCVRAGDLADRPFACVSDGQRQRIMLARALCQEPEIIVLDEPTSFLDIRHKIELLNILIEMAREKGMTVILSLHEIDLAAKVSDRVMCVQGDRITHLGTPEEIFTPQIIGALYGIEHGSYDVRFGSVELGRPQGTPDTFVLCGGGCGIPVFRQLQRRRIPFYAGVLFDNDMDYAVARPLATRVFVQPAFTSEDARVTQAALEALDACKTLIHSGVPILEGNRACGALLRRALEKGMEIRRNEP